MADTNEDIPRWAQPLGAETWHKINEMIDAGFKTMDIAREVSIPEAKVRSLQMYVRRFGPRRRLVKFAQFKDALVSQIEQFGADMVRSLSVLAALAVSNETKPATQVRAFEAMTQFTNTLKSMMADDAKTEEQRTREESGEVKVDVNDVVRRVLERYGVDGGASSNG